MFIGKIRSIWIDTWRLNLFGLTYFEIVRNLETVCIDTACWEIELFYGVQIGIWWEVDLLLLELLIVISGMFRVFKLADCKIVDPRRNRWVFSADCWRCLLEIKSESRRFLGRIFDRVRSMVINDFVLFGLRWAKPDFSLGFILEKELVWLFGLDVLLFMLADTECIWRHSDCRNFRWRDNWGISVLALCKAVWHYMLCFLSLGKWLTR